MGFIPSFHFEPADKKLTPEWCMDVIGYHYNTDNRNLLEGKNTREIEEFSNGKWDMAPFKKMFKSMRKKLQQARRNPDGSLVDDVDTIGIDWECVPLIPTKLNSAVSTIHKIPIEVTCTALDGLAAKKKDEDLTFLKNKALIENDLQDIADQMQLGKVDIGTTKNSFEKYSDTPLGLDLNEPDEENIFVKLLYSLTVETAFEKALKQIDSIKKGSQVSLMEIRDQFKYGVSVNRPFISSMTGMPDLEYIYPGDVSTPVSNLPDFSDNTHRVVHHSCTPLELFNYFSDEICDKATLDDILNDEEGGYCKCNRTGTIDAKEWNSYRLTLKYIEVRSVDWIGVGMKKKSSGNIRYFTTNPKECVSKIWAQNTYGFWWLFNTKHCFGIHRLPFSHRTKGQESYQNFSTNIYKSQKKSAVEHCIGENKKAQIADIKLQHALIKSLPSGKYIDLRFLRSALSGLKKESNQYTLQDLINLTFEHNQIIGDTEGFEGKNDGQMKPTMPIPGGLNLTEIAGYVQIMQIAAQNISAYTGINEQLTGQSANPEGLVGLQKLLINSSINSIQYVNESVKVQQENKFNLWANYLKAAIEAGGKTKQAVINMIGINDTRVLDGLNDVPVHDLSMKISLGQREIERQNFLDKLNFYVQKGIITSADEYLLSGIDNPKERFAALAVIEKRFMKKQDQIRAEQFQQSQALLQQQGQNMMAGKQAEGQEAVKQIYAKGDVQAKLLELGSQLGLSQTQMDAVVKRALQSDRNKAQLNKTLASIQAKADVEQQQQVV